MLHRRWLFLLCILSPLFLEQVAWSSWQALPKQNKKKLNKQLKNSLKPRKIALILGINRSMKSIDWNPLRFARRDAHRVARALRKQAGFDTIFLATTAKSTTKQRILHLLKRLSQQVKSQEDMVLIYVSAHGVVSRGRERYIVTSDTTRKVSKTGLSVKLLRKMLRRLRSRKICLILATCYTGNVRSKAVRVHGTKGAIAPASPFKFVRAIQILSAASFAQPAFESRRLKSDVYTHFFLECMRKLSKKTIIRIHICATTKTTHYVQKWNGEVQVPKAYSVLGANRDFSLVDGFQKGRLGYFYARTKGNRPLLYRVFRVGKKSDEQISVCSSDQMTALPPGRYRIRIQSEQGKLIGEEELVIRGGHVSQILSSWSLEGQGGVTVTGGVLQLGGERLGTGWFGFRHPNVAFLFGAWGTSLSFEDKTFFQTALELRFEAGFHKRWGRISMFGGGFVSAGLIFQDVNQDLNLGTWFQGGVTGQVAMGLSERWSILANFDVGAVVVPATRQVWNVSWVGGIRLGLRYRLGG